MPPTLVIRGPNKRHEIPFNLHIWRTTRLNGIALDKPQRGHRKRPIVKWIIHPRHKDILAARTVTPQLKNVEHGQWRLLNVAQPGVLVSHLALESCATILWQLTTVAVARNQSLGPGVREPMKHAEIVFDFKSVGRNAIVRDNTPMSVHRAVPNQSLTAGRGPRCGKCPSAHIFASIRQALQAGSLPCGPTLRLTFGLIR
ncbi:MAG: hypothetical protein ABSH36_00615 [Solirubrobacteraceae bacterium]